MTHKNDIDHALIIKSFQSVAWLARNLTPPINDKPIFHWIRRKQIPGWYWLQIRDLGRVYNVTVRGPRAKRAQRITLELIALTAPPPKRS